MMNFLEHITEYWSELVLLIAVVGAAIRYVLKEIFDYNLRKKEIKFINLHKVRAEKINLLYQGLVEMETALENFLQIIHKNNSLKHESDLQKVATKSIRRYQNLIRLNELYFSENTNNMLFDIEKACSEALINASTVFEGDDDTEEIWREKGTRTFEDLKSEINPAKIKLKAQFQKLMGVKPQPYSS